MVGAEGGEGPGEALGEVSCYVGCCGGTNVACCAVEDEFVFAGRKGGHGHDGGRGWEAC